MAADGGRGPFGGEENVLTLIVVTVAQLCGCPTNMELHKWVNCMSCE